jgi:hypothetical protein
LKVEQMTTKHLLVEQEEKSSSIYCSKDRRGSKMKMRVQWVSIREWQKKKE